MQSKNARGNGEYTSSEIASIIGWRYARNDQREWPASVMMVKFGLTRNGANGFWDELDVPVRRESRHVRTSGGPRLCNVFVLPSKWRWQLNGHKTHTKTGAFVIAEYLARQKWATTTELAEMVGWNRKRTRQLVARISHYLPLVRYYRLGRDADSLWVSLDAMS